MAVIDTYRATVQEVRELVPLTQTSDGVIRANFIDTANAIIETNLLTVNLSDRILAKIETYLAAHFLVIAEEKGAIVKDAFGDSATTWANIYSAGLGSTRFGQQAMALDPSGTLVRVTSTKLRAQFRVV